MNNWDSLTIEEINAEMQAETLREDASPQEVVAELYRAAKLYAAAIMDVAVAAPTKMSALMVKNSSEHISRSLDMAANVITARQRWSNAGHENEPEETQEQ